MFHVEHHDEREAAMERADLNPNDMVVFLSPFTGKESTVSYRGEFNGKAMIWTGMTQYAVEYRDLIRKVMGEEPTAVKKSLPYHQRVAIGRRHTSGNSNI